MKRLAWALKEGSRIIVSAGSAVLPRRSFRRCVGGNSDFHLRYIGMPSVRSGSEAGWHSIEMVYSPAGLESRGKLGAMTFEHVQSVCLPHEMSSWSLALA